MSQNENHWNEVYQIEIELMRHMVVLGLDWHDEAAMMKLAAECKAFGPVRFRRAETDNQSRIFRPGLRDDPNDGKRRTGWSPRTRRRRMESFWQTPLHIIVMSAWVCLDIDLIGIAK
jgi:hypothetical protein